MIQNPSECFIKITSMILYKSDNAQKGRIFRLKEGSPLVVLYIEENRQSDLKSVLADHEADESLADELEDDSGFGSASDSKAGLKVSGL